MNPEGFSVPKILSEIPIVLSKCSCVDGGEEVTGNRVKIKRKLTDGR